MAKLLNDETKAARTEAPTPWLGRDGYVAETAVRLDKLSVAVDWLVSECRSSRDRLEGLEGAADTARRERAFETTLRNSRELKLDEIVRTVRDLKERIAAIQGTRAAFAGLTYKSFEAVDTKVKELADAQVGLKRDLWLMGVALAASLAINLGVVAARLFG